MGKDIFVSYSRRNQAVCRSLVAALARTESDTWVDWEGIPLSSDWWSEIQRGIEEAETFLILLSNDWLASPVCHLEAAYARRFNKRIVPVVYGKIDSDDTLKELTDRELDLAVVDLLDGQALDALARDNWRALSKINWAFYQEDDFTEGASKLLAALQTDLNHARTHTRLLNRALEWQRGGQDVSLLLRGIDLDQAVGWLAYEKGKEPFITDLHTQYIDASVAQRKTEEDAVREQQVRELALKARALNRARLLIASLGVFLVVAALLTVFALQQRTEAIEQAERADREAQIAKAREVAAQALGLMGNRPAQAALLAIAAYQTAPVFETESALLTLVGEVQGRLKAYENLSGSSMTGLTYSPSDRWLAASHAFGEERLTLLDGATGEVASRLTGEGVGVLAVHFLDDETLLFAHAAGVSVASVGPQAQLTDISQRFSFESPPEQAAFSLDGARVTTAVRTADGLLVQAYDSANGEVMVSTVLGTADSTFIRFNFHPSKRYFIVNLTFSPPQLIDLENGDVMTIQTENPATTGILQAYFHTSSQYLVLAALPGGDSNFIALYDPATNSLQTAAVVSQNVLSLIPNPNGGEVVAFESGGKFKTYLISGGRILFDRSYHETDITTVAFRNTDFSYFVTGDNGGVVAWWDDSAAPPLQAIIEDDINLVIAMSLVNGRLAAVLENDSIRQWDATSWEPVGPTIDLRAEGVYLNRLFLSPDHTRLYGLVLETGLVRVWDAMTGELLEPSLTEDVPLANMEVSPDGRWLVGYSAESALGAWDAATGQALTEPQPLTDDLGEPTADTLVNLTFSADGTRLAAVGDMGGLWVLAVAEGGMLTQEHSYRFPTPLQYGLSFSPDGEVLAIATNSNTVLLIEVETGQLVTPPLSGSDSYIYTLRFRPDGRVLAVINGDSELWLWDTARGLPIGTPTVAHYINYDAVFTPDGQSLITVGSNPVISEWDFSPQRSVEVLCASVGRDLTPEEWTLYIGQTEVYHPVCASGS
ncbi:MAG: TIR domain-containing protein [Anaerolineae bacterium]|nr:TIR domain-containing protein [Anaerolineae bacterium]